MSKCLVITDVDQVSFNVYDNILATKSEGGDKDIIVCKHL